MCVRAVYLWRGVRARVLPLVQLVPALHQLDDHGVAEVDQLEARDVGAAVHEALQVDVLKTLQQVGARGGGGGGVREWGGVGGTTGREGGQCPGSELESEPS